jgi:hypothetical protein
MNAKERLVEYLKEKKIGQTAFENISGLSRGQIAKKQGLTSDSLLKIAQSMPELNLNWLLTGRGDMYNSLELAPDVRAINMNIGNRIEKIREFYFGEYGSNKLFSEKLGEKEQTTSNWTKRGENIGLDVIRKIESVFSDINLNWLISGKGEMLKSNQNQLQPSKSESESEEIKTLREQLNEKDRYIEKITKESYIRDEERYQRMFEKEVDIRKKDEIISEKDTYIRELNQQKDSLVQENKELIRENTALSKELELIKRGIQKEENIQRVFTPQ